MPEASYSSDEIARLGRAIYDREIRQQIEAGHLGQFVVIDVESGKFEIASDHLTAVKKARAKYPEASLFTVRVGYPAAARIGGRVVTRGSSD